MGTTFIAAKADSIVGSFSVKVQNYRENRVGFIDAIVTDRYLRGQGIGTSLFDACLKWLQDQSCDIIVATVDRYNSPSWNLFLRNNFWIYETKDQIKELGWTFLRLWLAEFYFIAIGVFFLRKRSEKNQPKETGQPLNLLTAWIGLTLIVSVLGLRSGAEPIIYPFLVAVAAVSILVHEAAHILASKHYGVEAVFKAWDSGLLFSLFLSVFGAVFPAYGSTYMKQRDWRYEAGSRRIGIIYAVGPIVSLILSALFLTLSMNTSSLSIKRVM